jgi:hypothetical protein
MIRFTYPRYELLRRFRNWRFLVFVLAYPVVLYLVVTEPQRHHAFDGAMALPSRSTSWPGWRPSAR